MRINITSYKEITQFYKFVLVIAFLFALKGIKAQNDSRLDSAVNISEVIVNSKEKPSKLLWILLKKHNRKLSESDTTLYYKLNFMLECKNINLREHFDGTVSYEYDKGKVECFVHDGEYTSKADIKEKAYIPVFGEFSSIASYISVPKYRKFKKNTVIYSPKDTAFYLSNEKRKINQAYFFNRTSLKAYEAKDLKERSLLGFKVMSFTRKAEYNKASILDYFFVDAKYTFRKEKYSYTFELNRIKENKSYSNKIKLKNETPESIYKKIKSISG